jgi:glycosyltransferase involved in cell wall biosynthesis
MADLRVGLDYGAGTRHAPGVGRYARELVRALAALAPQRAELHLLDVGTAPRTLVEPALGLQGRPAVAQRLIGDVPRGAARLLARPLGVESWFGGLDHVHQVLRPLWPVRRATSSLAVSELPRCGSAAEADLREALAQVDEVHVFSQHYREELGRRFELESERIVQVPVGCDHWKRELHSSEEAPTEDLILVLGAQRREREPLSVLRAFERLVALGREARLLFAGRRGDASAELERALETSPCRDRVRLASDVGEHELPGLVARASALVHLSAEEGTPVTPLEAFSVGTAVVATPLPAFLEALGSEACWVEADESEERASGVLRALERALEDARGAAALRRIELASAFTWEACARATLEAWEARARASS